jgi:hypothetical protein
MIRPRRVARPVVVALDAQVGEIVSALKVLGGEAHRTLVLQQIAVHRSGRPGVVTPRLEQEVIAAFQAHCRRPADMPARVTGRFGADSHRWQLA